MLRLSPFLYKGTTSASLASSGNSLVSTHWLKMLARWWLSGLAAGFTSFGGIRSWPVAFFAFRPRRICSTLAAVVCRNEKAVVFMLLLMSTMLGCLSKWYAHLETKSTFVSLFCDTSMFSVWKDDDKFFYWQHKMIWNSRSYAGGNAIDITVHGVKPVKVKSYRFLDEYLGGVITEKGRNEWD